MAARDPRDTVRRLLALGSAVTGVSKDDVEELLHDVVNFQGEGRERLEELGEEVLARTRRSVERLGGVVRDELHRELEARARALGQPGDLLRAAADLLGELLGHRRQDAGGSGASRSPGETAAEPLEASGRVQPPTGGPGGEPEPPEPPAAKRAARKGAAERRPAGGEEPSPRRAARKRPAPAGEEPPRASRARKAAMSGTGEQPAKKAAAPRRTAAKAAPGRAAAGKATGRRAPGAGPAARS